MSDFDSRNGKGNASFLHSKDSAIDLPVSGAIVTNLPLSVAEPSGALFADSDPSSAIVVVPQASSALFFPQQIDAELVRQTTPDEYLPPIGRWISICGVATIGIFCAAIGLSSILKYQTTVQAPATLRPTGELRIVQSAIEGSVASIPVRENQAVKAGDIIATVRDVRLESKLKTKRAQLSGDKLKNKHQVGKIDAQLSALQQQNLGERDQNDRSIAGIQAELSRAERDYQDKQRIGRAEVAEASANIETAKKDKQAAEMELLVATANLKSIQSAHQAAVAKRDRYQSVGAAGAISQNLVEESQLSAEQQLQAIAAQKATLAKQQQTIARLQQIIVSTQARSTRTQVALDPSRADIELVQHKIERERANGKTAIARFQQERQKLLQQRVEITNQIATTDREIAQIGTDLQPTPIVAPIAGTIQQLALRNNNQVVHPGDSLAKILPTGTPLQVKASVALADIGKVDVGQTVKMRVSACPYTENGILTGKVIDIAADAKSIDKNAATPSANIYEVTIAPATTSLGTGKTTCQTRSGMEGRVDIITKEETVLNFMLSKARLLLNP
ncbi:HlyD family efflux transporter periplasmic adaptor subunit [Chamaesiphon sp. OTE_8_metabat_110]|uniref:HlyD family efflux transporter periplasmic adaptor subunit n=1 Tax=Chamaesiphon sp. OTE_8_metabat_110 TaxID=2964696 RepID=UPI00286B2612|nr:HlyD family efflux transporter periplasmic adaptor subunit [Chamaesiphon sp. OTE_8_metabat_110]